MKKLVLISVLVGFIVMPVLAVPDIEFSPGGVFPGRWYYDGAGTFTFNQIIDVDKGLGNPGDALVGAWVHIPQLSVSGIPGGPYTLMPVTGTIVITDSTGVFTYLVGTLGSGDLYPLGTGALAYPAFQVDITNITVYNPIGSAALATIDGHPLDFELTLNGATGGFQNMLDNGLSRSDGFSGAMTVIPEPTTILLFTLGGLVLRKSQR
jgi:hypothetical protein